MRFSSQYEDIIDDLDNEESEEDTRRFLGQDDDIVDDDTLQEVTIKNESVLMREVVQNQSPRKKRIIIKTESVQMNQKASESGGEQHKTLTIRTCGSNSARRRPPTAERSRQAPTDSKNS